MKLQWGATSEESVRRFCYQFYLDSYVDLFCNQEIQTCHRPNRVIEAVHTSSSNEVLCLKPNIQFQSEYHTILQIF